MTVYPTRPAEQPATARPSTRRCSSGSRTRTWSRRRAGRRWAPAGYVAYSKVCTHLGCPVGLYEQQLELLVCPCHQSMFNVRNGAVPQFGPAPRPLPQLPLYFDSDGTLRAQARLRPGRRARLLRADHDEGERDMSPALPTAKSKKQALGPYGRVGNIDRRARRPPRASPRAAGSSWTRSSPTTGPSCWARSPCTRSSC